ncbi:D-Ala-D-Ala carboxypeptidase family metallohydrolase [Caballeronia insecticola]|uniref:Uncharacterized protein n=1 Tax=Caballeronia insecticola TaxID=758793 RepID=R4WSC3_9BURK|nr:D-Ala-D-Ala carboxypeptidase family metallohydrolase [Caballeronia insecticola]BAN21761.1 putative uncharacterized protein [Caballeronia insecticola]
MNLTAHFTLDELTPSRVAARRGIDNTPSEAVIANLRRTAQTLEQLRALLGANEKSALSGVRSRAPAVPLRIWRVAPHVLT